jgi:hypothetical protein
MITPAPTSRIDPKLARGVLAQAVPATATTLEFVKLTFPNTNYELHLLPSGPIATAPGKRILGVIRAKARRIDSVETGGRYIEPVYGRPRRIQGSVIAVTGDAVVVDAGVPIHVTPTHPTQKPTEFREGQFVSFDALDGSTFTPSA